MRISDARASGDVQTWTVSGSGLLPCIGEPGERDAGPDRRREAPRVEERERGPMSIRALEQAERDLEGRTIVVTGANSGIGFAATRQLAARGARVVLACRSAPRAERAIDHLQRDLPDALLEFEELDLAHLSSVADCAARLNARLDRLDVLCHNAGVMALPRTLTRDGFEMQIGVNHLGHFALAGQLLPLLFATPGARIVQVGSRAHILGRVRLDDLHGERRYGKWRAYANSKLANLLYLHALSRRLEAHGDRLTAVGAHPGYAATEILADRDDRVKPSLRERLFRLGNRLIAQSVEDGARPTVAAATAVDARNGDYYGPSGWLQMWGAQPRKVSPAGRARNDAAAEALWRHSIELTGVDYAGLDQAAIEAGPERVNDRTEEA